MELCVADPSSATQEITKNTFQTILTKFSSTSKVLSHQEMCSRLLKTLDNDRRVVRFLLKQCVFDSGNQGQKSASVMRAYEKLKQENTQLKQASSSQRIQMEQTIADLQHRIQALTGTVDELQRTVKEKDTQVAQFRELYAREGRKHVPSTSYSDSSLGRHSKERENGHGHVHRSTGMDNPPMQSFLIQKQARERAKEQSMEQASRSRSFPALGHRRSSNEEPAVTPIQFPGRPTSIGSGSTLGGTSSTHVRDIRSSSGYIFTSRPSHSSKRHRSSVSPTNAFAFNHNRDMSPHFPRDSF
jgi:hypothetical protein